MDDGTGSATAADSSGNNNTGTLTNMDPNTDWVTGRVGGALDFDGTNDFVQISGLMGSPAAITLAGWVNFTAKDTNGAHLLSIGDMVTLDLADGTGNCPNSVRGFYYIGGSAWRNTCTTKNIRSIYQSL